MIQKLAVLVVEKADGSVVLTAGSKGDIIVEGKALIRSTNESSDHDIARITVLGQMGVIKERTWKGNAREVKPAPVVGGTPAGSGEGDDDEGNQSADVAAIREALKAKGVKVPPRINIENLLALAIEHGVEV